MELNLAYIDINVILDLFLKREPNRSPVAELFQFAKTGTIKLFTSPISYDTLYYILRRSGMSDQLTRRKIKILLRFVAPTQINKTTIESALLEK